MLKQTIPPSKVEAILTRTGKVSQRRRELPAQVVVYYVIALTLYMAESYREVLRFLRGGLGSAAKGTPVRPRVAAKSSISEARSRLGWEPRKELHDEVVGPIATAKTKGAW